MKKLLYTAAAVCLAAAFFITTVHAQPVMSAKCCILIDTDTGEVLYEHQADRASLIASTTKIMTAVVALEHAELNTKFEIPAQAAGIEGSSMYLKVGEILTVEELLYGMMLQSGNDAAIALALACSGSVEEFVALMNLKAQELQLQNTHFENPNGLDGEKHYSSARDLAKLTQYALQNEVFARIVATKTKTVAGRTLTNHNRLLWRCDGCVGVKTGYTKAAGRTLVSAAERNGRRLIAVTLCDGNDWQDHRTLYDYGFSLYQQKTIVQKGEPVAKISLMNGQNISLLAAENVDYFLKEGEKVTVTVDYPKSAFESGEAYSAAGYGTVYLGSRKIATIELLWGDGSA